MMLSFALLSLRGRRHVFVAVLDSDMKLPAQLDNRIVCIETRLHRLLELRERAARERAAREMCSSPAEHELTTGELRVQRLIRKSQSSQA